MEENDVESLHISAVAVQLSTMGQQQHIYEEILRHIGRISLHYSRAKKMKSSTSL